MNIDVETTRKLREMGAGEIADAFRLQDESACISMTVEERIQMAVDEAYASFVDAKIKGLVSRANLRYPDADIRHIDFADGRGINRQLIFQLAAGGYIRRKENIVFQGFTGSGKSFLACSLAKEACKNRIRAHYIRMPDLEALWAEAREKPMGEKKLLRKYASFSVLVLDEWLLDKPDARMRAMLLELMELRYDVNSTIFCTQYKLEDWHIRLGGGAHADAIMDRIVHNTTWVETGEHNMRERTNKERREQ